MLRLDFLVYVIPNAQLFSNRSNIFSKMKQVYDTLFVYIYERHRCKCSKMIIVVGHDNKIISTTSQQILELFLDYFFKLHIYIMFYIHKLLFITCLYILCLFI